jgi:hypothetical protein
VPISEVGEPGEPSEVSFSGTLAWNLTAGVYGYLGAESFQRYNENGLSIGGPISEDTTKTGHQMFVNDNSWYVIGSRGSVADVFYNTCSLINSGGVLQVDSTQIAKRVSQGELIGDAFWAPIASNKLFSVLRASDGAGTYSFIVGTYNFDGSTCAVSGEAKNGLGKRTEKIYSFFNLDSATSALLYSSAGALIIGSFNIGGIPALNSESSVARYTSLLGATAKILKGKIYVGYVNDGGGYISYSTETVQ